MFSFVLMLSGPPLSQLEQLLPIAPVRGPALELSTLLFNYAQQHTGGFTETQQHTGGFTETQQHTGGFAETQQHTGDFTETQQHTGGFTALGRTS